MTRPKAFRREITKTVDGPTQEGASKPTRVRVGTGKFGLQAACPAKTCKRFGKSTGLNEHGIVMLCSCGEIFIAEPAP